MNIEELRDYCLNKKGVTESFPFDKDTLVFKVMNKMFALTGLTGDLKVSLKCDPEKAVELREHYDFVRPGYHMSKVHWNTIDIFKTMDDRMLKSWIDDSYNLIVKSLTKKLQAELNELSE
jgi:predicted DNA-binding protein (MmcQ/YjbR family)